jgi:5-methylcytosine-specific restriction endonuclease McrA
MPPLSALTFYALLGLAALFASLMLAEDLIVLVARFWGILPKRPVYGAARSARWPALRRKYLALHPHCAACGATEQMEVHHIRPFHLRPDLELDSENLIGLCEKHGCHLAFGHNYDWQAFNSPVGEDCRIQAMRTKQRRYE